MPNTQTPAPGDLRRELKPRHLSMIAIGGSIGTGLFVASVATIAEAGPAGGLFAYSLIGLMVCFMMASLGEMATCPDLALLRPMAADTEARALVWLWVGR